MKKKILIVSSLLVTALLFQMCDYVRNANQTATSTTQQAGKVYRKVLVEDYTGHKCGNCPRAAETLTQLEGIYGSQIVPMAVHAGFFAVVTPSSVPPYPTDLRSTAGTDYDNTFGNSIAGNPNGLVNRKNHDSASLFIKAYSAWGAAVASMNTQLADFQIKITNTFNTSSNQLTSVVTSKALNGKTGPFNLVVLLTEDSIIAEQEDYSLPTGPPNYQRIPNYLFNHVLRGAINSSWGDPIFPGVVNKNDSIVKTYNYTLPSTYKYKHCHVVAFIYDANTANLTYYEVLQVETKELY